MKRHLHPTPNPIAERFKFNSRIRQSNEMVASFVASLRQLTEHCEFSTTVDMLRDRLVCGINNNKFQQRLLAEGRTLTYDRALEPALSMEAAEENSSTIGSFQQVHASGVHQSELRNKEFNDINKLSPNTTARVSGASNICFRCGGKNHRPDKCTRFKIQKNLFNINRFTCLYLQNKLININTLQL